MFDARFFVRPVATVAAIFALAQAAVGGVTVRDTYQRSINACGLTLVDWDGYLANPAIKFVVTVPYETAMPASAVLTADHPRLYFDLPSSVGANGPSKTIQFTTTSKSATVYMSVFPDRDGVDENYTLSIRLTDKNGSQSVTQVPVHVIDQDAGSAPSFNIITDFSTDQSGFFSDPLKRAIIQQAAGDWAYFIDGSELNQVAARSESTWIWGPNGWAPGAVGFTVTNSSAYTGFLLYAYGIHTSELRSGGEGSYGGGYQHSGPTQLPLRRSGGLEIETQGNYHTLGWFLTASDDDWWVSANYTEPTDLYSIAHHEIGHSIALCSAYSKAASAQAKGYFDDPAIVSYLGRTLPIDASYHFAGIVDPVSKRGVFGGEYSGTVPGRRWLINRLDLLALQAAGYTLRNVSALAPLSVAGRTIPSGKVAGLYSEKLMASGGIPTYEWSVIGGMLPPGLLLDSFSGVISGTPTKAGNYVFSVRVRDNSPNGSPVTASFSMSVQPATDRVVGLSNASARYALTTQAPDQMTFVIWGKVISANSGGFILDDGSGCPIWVNAPGHTLKVGEWGRARGVLSSGSSGPVMTSAADMVNPAK